MWDYYLGGNENTDADREAARLVLGAAPDVPLAALENREFLKHAVRFLAAESGISLFIDIGPGLPTRGPERGDGRPGPDGTAATIWPQTVGCAWARLAARLSPTPPASTTVGHDSRRVMMPSCLSRCLSRTTRLTAALALFLGLNARALQDLDHGGLGTAPAGCRIGSYLRFPGPRRADSRVRTGSMTVINRVVTL